jgi:hypothetical protein
LEDLGVDGKVLKWIFKKWDWRKVDWIELAQDMWKYTAGGKSKCLRKAHSTATLSTVNHNRTTSL